MLSQERRVAIIVTSGYAEKLLEVARQCSESAESGASVRVFFRDESIPSLCRPEVAARLLPDGDADAAELRGVHEQLEALADRGDVRLHACSSSLYIWGVESRDLIPAIAGARGLIAFLADDLAGASEVLTY